MPFQPLPDSGYQKPNSVDVALLVLRIVAVTAFVYYQLLAQWAHALDYVWDQADWDLVDRTGSLGLPFPGVFATVFVALLTISLLGVLVGFFTRINAITSLILTAIALVAPLELSTTLNPQTLILYLSLFLALLCGGAGNISLDYFLAGRKARRRRIG
ncbi:MAG: hypothetical protein WD342_13345 [Verrucomicrobiales bacterium]